MAKKAPLRKCTGCQAMKDKREMLRIVKTNEDEFYMDITGKMNGRGAYICKDKECLEKALKNKGLERSFKCRVPEEIGIRLKEEMNSLE